MKIIVNINDNPIIVPCAAGVMSVRLLVQDALCRYKKYLGKGDDCNFTIEKVVLGNNNGILDLDDRVCDLLSDMDAITCHVTRSNHLLDGMSSRSTLPTSTPRNESYLKRRSVFMDSNNVQQGTVSASEILTNNNKDKQKNEDTVVCTTVQLGNTLSRVYARRETASTPDPTTRIPAPSQSFNRRLFNGANSQFSRNSALRRSLGGAEAQLMNSQSFVQFNSSNDTADGLHGTDDRSPMEGKENVTSLVSWREKANDKFVSSFPITNEPVSIEAGPVDHPDRRTNPSLHYSTEEVSIRLKTIPFSPAFLKYHPLGDDTSWRHWLVQQISLKPYYDSSNDQRLVGLEISAISEETPFPLKQKLVKGDKILAVNDRPLEGLIYHSCISCLENSFLRDEVTLNILPSSVAASSSITSSIPQQMLNNSYPLSNYTSLKRIKSSPSPLTLQLQQSQSTIAPVKYSSNLNSDSSQTLVHESLRDNHSTLMDSQNENATAKAGTLSRQKSADSNSRNVRTMGKKLSLSLWKASIGGFGFTLTTRDVDTSGVGITPIYIKKILAQGAAILDSRLQVGDRLLKIELSNGQVYDCEQIGYNALTNILREQSVNSQVKFTISRHDDGQSNDNDATLETDVTPSKMINNESSSENAVRSPHASINLTSDSIAPVNRRPQQQNNASTEVNEDDEEEGSLDIPFIREGAGRRSMSEKRGAMENPARYQFYNEQWKISRENNRGLETEEVDRAYSTLPSASRMRRMQAEISRAQKEAKKNEKIAKELRRYSTVVSHSTQSKMSSTTSEMLPVHMNQNAGTLSPSGFVYDSLHNYSSSPNPGPVPPHSNLDHSRSSSVVQDMTLRSYTPSNDTASGTIRRGGVRNSSFRKATDRSTNGNTSVERPTAVVDTSPISTQSTPVKDKSPFSLNAKPLSLSSASKLEEPINHPVVSSSSTVSPVIPHKKKTNPLNNFIGGLFKRGSTGIEKDNSTRKNSVEIESKETTAPSHYVKREFSSPSHDVSKSRHITSSPLHISDPVPLRPYEVTLSDSRLVERQHYRPPAAPSVKNTSGPPGLRSPDSMPVSSGNPRALTASPSLVNPYEVIVGPVGPSQNLKEGHSNKIHSQLPSSSRPSSSSSSARQNRDIAMHKLPYVPIYQPPLENDSGITITTKQKPPTPPKSQGNSTTRRSSGDNPSPVVYGSNSNGNPGDSSFAYGGLHHGSTSPSMRHMSSSPRLRISQQKQPQYKEPVHIQVNRSKF